MRAPVFGVLLAVLAAGAVFPVAAWGQADASRPQAGFDSKPIGKVQTVKGTVTIEHPTGIVVQANLPGSGNQQTKADDLVYQGDIVQTGRDGAVGIIFGDGASFDISANARMEIDEFVYDPKGSSNSTLFNLTKGTFTFLAGKTAKTGNMKVETPVGTMGIRGTAPHVEISDDGTVKFTTLVEEHKNIEAQKPSPAVALPPRQNQKPSPALNICRNC